MRLLIALAIVVAVAPSAPLPITPPSHFHKLAHTYSIDVRVRMDGKIDRVILEDILKKRR